jgi:Putative Ig domain
MRAAKRAVGGLGILAAVLLFAAAPMGCSDCDTEITTNTLPDGIVGVAYAFTVASNCGGDFWFVSEGNLPPGIGLLDNGILRGTPSDVGTSTFTLGVIDSDTGERAFKGLSLTIEPAA